MAAVDKNSNAAFVLQSISRHMNCLSDESKITRKKAIEGLRKETLDRKPPLQTSELTIIFKEVLKSLLKTISDPAERCREEAIKMTKEFLKKLQDPGDYLSFIVPVIVQRLGQQEIVEQSEELRLLLVELFHEILVLSGKRMSIYLDDAIKILQKTITDPFPDVRKESCHCTSMIAKTIPEYFHMQSESLIKPLLLSITHQHGKIRSVVVETIGDVLMYGNSKMMDQVVSHLAQRLFDSTPAVRRSVTQVVGNWLLDLPDRYSFHHKLIPLLLTSISDEQPGIRELADALWYDVGMKYERENEDDFKDKLDFPKPEPSHYPPNTERPNFGCRALVGRHVSKIIPGLMHDIHDWVLETRIKSASLLYTLLLNTEDNMTQHMEMILAGMYKASMDEDPKVVINVRRSAELVGYFVSAQVWCNMILTNLKLTQSPGVALILAAIIHGSSPEQLQPVVPQICQTLATSDMCHTVQAAMHEQLLACCNAVIEVAGSGCQEVSYQLFGVLMTVQALAQDPIHREQVRFVLDKLSKAVGLESCSQLYDSCALSLIDVLKASHNTWSSHSLEHQIFTTLLLESGAVVGTLLEHVIPTLVENMQSDRDPEMRLKLFSLLSKLLLNASQTLNSQQQLGSHAMTVVQNIILPNCLWQAGRTAGAIRTAAVSSLWALLQSGVLTREQLTPEVEPILTQILSTMEDDNKSTRLISCRVMTRIFDLLGSTLDRDRLHNIYPDLLKRLDDSSDEIRITVSKTFLAYLDCFQGKYDVVLYRAHLEVIYRGLLIHLDDPEEKIQLAILDVLKKAGELFPPMLLAEVELVQHKHRTDRFCKELADYLLSLPKA